MEYIFKTHFVVKITCETELHAVLISYANHDSKMHRTNSKKMDNKTKISADAFVF